MLISFRGFVLRKTFETCYIDYIEKKITVKKRNSGSKL